AHVSERLVAVDGTRLEFQRHVRAALVGVRGHLLEAFERTQLLLHRPHQQALGVLRRDAFMHHADVGHRDLDVRFRLLGNAEIGDEAGEQDEHQQEDDRSRSFQRRFNDAVHVQSPWAGATVLPTAMAKPLVSSRTVRTLSPGFTKPWPTVMMRAASGRPAIHMPLLVDLTTSMRLKRTVPSSATVLMPISPFSSRARIDGEMRCAKVCPAGTCTCAVMPAGRLRSGFGTSSSTRKVRVASSATGAM